MKKLITIFLILIASPASHADVTDGLVSWWKFDEGSGSSAADASGEGHTGALTNGPTWVAGKKGQAVSFDGTNKYVNVPAGGGLNNVSTASIAMWVQWTGTQNAGYSGYGSILGRQSNGQFSDNVISLTTSDPNTAKISWSFKAAGAGDMISATSPISGRWRHVVITFTSGDHKIYLDGVLDASSAPVGTTHNNIAVPLTIGAWIDDGVSYSTSLIDDVRIYNHVLTAQEVNAIYIAGTPRVMLKGQGRLMNFKM